jgi:hypothetical protein
MRRKIWELPEFQCSVIGTCLSLEELKKLARKTHLKLSDEHDEFKVHAVFVKLSSQQGPVAKAVNKNLDKKYATVLRRFGAARGDERILELWREARAKGDIPGPYWAVLTHPESSSELMGRVFGEVHMLSHLVGAANRADIRRLAELERQLAEKEQRHAKALTVYRGRLRDMVTETRASKQKITNMAKELETARSQTKERGSEELRLENQGLQRALGAQSVMLLEASSRNETLARQIDAQERRIRFAEEELAEKRAEIRFLEEELSRLTQERELPACPGALCDKAGGPECPGPRLCGKRILYVGGRANLVQHYRALVERLGGEFLHHDGGLEQSRHGLPRIMGGVDAVLCPVDCVSHDACQCVKEVCKHSLKPCKLLRSSGLSSLVRSLEELASQPETERRS